MNTKTFKLREYFKFI